MRHTPLREKKADCWLIEVPGIEGNPVELIRRLSEKQLNYYSMNEVVIENKYLELTERQIQNVLSSAKKLRDFWWPAFLIVASLEVTYEFLPHLREKLGTFGLESGGEEFLSKVSKRNLSHGVRISDTRASVQVVEVDEPVFRLALQDILDQQEKHILQVLTDPDSDKCRQNSSEWAESLETELQKQLDNGVQWEDALSILQVNESSLFRRKYMPLQVKEWLTAVSRNPNTPPPEVLCELLHHQNQWVREEAKKNLSRRGLL